MTTEFIPLIEEKQLIENYFGNVLPLPITWNYIMPIVEKIGNYHYPKYYGKSLIPKDAGKWDDCAYPRTFGMRDAEGNYMVRFNASALFKGVTLIEATWNAIVDFVKWVNSQEFNAEMQSYEKEGLLKIITMPDEPKDKS